MKKKLMLNSRIVRISWPIWRKNGSHEKAHAKKEKKYWLWSVNFVKRNSRKKWIEKACKNSPCLVKNNLNVTFANENSDSSYLCTFLIICISKRFQVCKLNANMNLYFFLFQVFNISKMPKNNLQSEETPTMDSKHYKSCGKLFLVNWKPTWISQRRQKLQMWFLWENLQNQKLFDSSWNDSLWREILQVCKSMMKVPATDFFEETSWDSFCTGKTCKICGK